MPVLSNAKHERFAQLLADGKSAAEAYNTVGYRENRHNAATLARAQHISTRVAEILAQREEIHSQGTAKAIEKVALTKEWVLSTLIENVQRSMTAVPVMVKDGKDWVATGEYQYEGAVANKSLELLGKELGMFIDRKEVRTGPLTEASDDELDRIIRGAAAEAQIGLSASREGAETKH